MRIDVHCTPTIDRHRCEVEVVDRGSTSHHAVEVSWAELDRWGMGRSPEDLVRDSFRFLLEREPKESILREFKLSLIGRYFPEYEREITRGRP
jgi:hypothetical protein